jgi:hypothetical protein
MRILLNRRKVNVNDGQISEQYKNLLACLSILLVAFESTVNENMLRDLVRVFAKSIDKM